MSLTGSAISLIPDLPSQVMLPEKNYTSTSDAVLSRRHVEVSPINDGVTFNNSSNPEVTFNIASTTSFWDLENFYITGFLKVTKTEQDGRPAHSNADYYWKLNKCGISSLIESVEIRSASTNNPHDKLEAYNVFCAMEDNLFMTPETLDRNFIGEFKSKSDDDYGDKFTIINNRLAQTAGAHFTSSPNELSLTNTTVPVGDVFPPGDLVIGYGSGSGYTQDDVTGMMICHNDGITSGNVETENVGFVAIPGIKSEFWPNALDANVAQDLNALGDDVYAQPKIILHRSEYQMNIGRALIYKGDDAVPFTLKLRNGFLRQKKDFPLFLFPRGIQIVINFDRMCSLRSFHNINPSSMIVEGYDIESHPPTFTVEFTKLRAQCILKNYHSSVNNQYLDLFTSNKGILIPFTGYRFAQKTIPDGISTETIEINVGVRSARHVMARIIPQAWWNGQDTLQRGKYLDLLNMASPCGLASYQFKTGTLDFPIKAISSDVWFPADCKQHQLITGKMHRDQVNSSSRYEETPYLASSSSNVPFLPNVRYQHGLLTNEGSGVQAVIPLGHYLVETIARDDGYFAGTDVSMQPLRVELVFDSTTYDETFDESATYDPANKDYLYGDGARLFQCFVAHDCYLHLSEAGGIVRLS